MRLEASAHACLLVQHACLRKELAKATAGQQAASEAAMVDAATRQRLLTESPGVHLKYTEHCCGVTEEWVVYIIKTGCVHESGGELEDQEMQPKVPQIIFCVVGIAGLEMA